MDPEIRVIKLSRSYYPKQRKGLFESETSEVEALKSVSLEFHEGETFGLHGPNGAGKTTLIKCLITLQVPFADDAWIHGYHLYRRAETQARKTGSFSEYLGVRHL